MPLKPSNIKLATDAQLLMLYVFIDRMRGGVVLNPPADMSVYLIDQIEATLMAEIDRRCLVYVNAISAML